MSAHADIAGEQAALPLLIRVAMMPMPRQRHYFVFTRCHFATLRLCWLPAADACYLRHDI